MKANRMLGGMATDRSNIGQPAYIRTVYGNLLVWLCCAEPWAVLTAVTAPPIGHLPRVIDRVVPVKEMIGQRAMP